MPSAAIRRAQNLLKARSGPILAVHALGVLDSLLRLKLLMVAGLLLGLFSTRGVTNLSPRHLTDPEIKRLRVQAPWIAAQLPNYAPGEPTVRRHEQWLTNTGLYPLVARTRFDRNPLHRWAGGLLGFSMRHFRPLRDNLGALGSLLILGLIYLLVLAAVWRVRRWLAVDAGERLSTNLRNQIHRQMYRLGQSSLPNEGIGPVLDIFTRDVNEARTGLLWHLDSSIRLPVWILGLLLTAILVAPVQAVFLLSIGFLIWIVLRAIDRSREAEVEALAREAGVFLLLLHEDLGMLRTVRVYGMEGVDKYRFEEHLETHEAAIRRHDRAEDRKGPTWLLLAGSAAFLAAGLLGYNILNGRLNLASGLMLAFSLALMVRPIRHWLSRRRMVRRGLRAAEEVFTYLDRRPELQMTVGAQFLPPLRQRLTFESVRLETPSGRVLLSDFSAEMGANSRVALMSLDDEARLALVCLVPRLIDPVSGRVRVDGLDLRDVTLESIRAQVAMILQHDLTFSDSVLNNIGLGDKSYTLPRIIDAAKQAHAHHFIQELPRGYETVIGPLGHPLSIDEQYRIALARAFLHDPSIVVIEEPTEALEESIKPLIDDTVDRLAPGRLMIFLPHRLSTIRKCDQVIVLHNGRVEAVGTPKEVHGQSKLYRHMQYMEFNQFATGEIEAGQMG
jgi:ABC-type multidrug transport system fused ATPase/permease subunit